MKKRHVVVMLVILFGVYIFIKKKFQWKGSATPQHSNSSSVRKNQVLRLCYFLIWFWFFFKLLFYKSKRASLSPLLLLCLILKWNLFTVHCTVVCSSHYAKSIFFFWQNCALFFPGGKILPVCSAYIVEFSQEGCNKYINIPIQIKYSEFTDCYKPTYF